MLKMDNLKEWILKSGFTADDALASDIAAILYKGRLRCTWDFLVTRIRKKEEVNTIRGNLRLQKLKAENSFDKDDIERKEAIHEFYVLKKSLSHVTKETSHKEHEIQRLKTIVFEMNSKHELIRRDLLKSIAKNSQITYHHEHLSHMNKNITIQIASLNQWKVFHSEDKLTDCSSLLEICNSLKNSIHNVLLRGQSNDGNDLDPNVIANFAPKAIINGIIEATRSLELKIKAEMGKVVPIKPSKEEALEPLLQNLWLQHVESRQAYLAASGKTVEFQQETSRYLDEHLSNVHDELIKRYIKMKKSLRAGQAFVSCLQKHLASIKSSSDFEQIKDKQLIEDRYATVERQSKDQMKMKFLIEDLLSATSNHRARVGKICDQIVDKKADMAQTYGSDLPNMIESNHGLASDALKNVSHNSMPRDISIDRSGNDKRVLNFNLSLSLYKKTNFCQILQHVLMIMQQTQLSLLYLEKMKDFKEFGEGISAPNEMLGSLRTRLNKEKAQLLHVIDQKLSKNLDGEAGRKTCEKFKRALHIWMNEPAKGAYMTGLNPQYKGKTLNDWYNQMTSAN